MSVWFLITSSWFQAICMYEDREEEKHLWYPILHPYKHVCILVCQREKKNWTCKGFYGKKYQVEFS